MCYNCLHSFRHLTLLTFILFFTSLQVHAQVDFDKLTPQQKTFLNAYNAVKANDRPLIAQYKNQLQNYPLAHYIAYLDYYYHLDNTPQNLVLQFINTTPNSPLTARLKFHWLLHLGKTRQWTLFLKHYPSNTSSSTNLQCYAIQARYAKKMKSTNIHYAQKIWASHITLPDACQPLDQILRKENKISGSMVWQKIQLAMSKGQLKNATKISRDLSKTERQSFNYWLKVYRDPSLVLTNMPGSISPVVRQAIFKQGVQRLAYSKPELALKTLNHRKAQYGLNQTEYTKLQKNISLRFAYQYHPKAQQYLAKIDNASKDTKILSWEMRVAIRESNWVHFLDLYELLPKNRQQKHRWQYWKARALFELNQAKEANAIFNTLALERDFYGFLAADRLSLPYQFNLKPTQPYDLDVLEKKYPQLKIIKELVAINWHKSLKREWYYLLKHLPKQDIEAVAQFMANVNQHNLAIQTVSKVKEWDQLAIRFPMPYKSPIMKAADKNTIDPAWVYGVIRRESAFSPIANSSVGAIGLMQLMPQTARYIGQKIGFSKQQYTRLTQPESNIKLGSAYLSYLDDKYNGNRILATAAYNAGPRRVDQWIPKDRVLSADQWVDTIPFTETRNYVKAVLEYTTIFKSLMNNVSYDRLKRFMLPIGQQPTVENHTELEKVPS